MTILQNRSRGMTIIALGLLVCACGGGSTGSSISAKSTTPPPPPPPPPPTNSSLVNLQYNETFKLASAVLSADVDIIGNANNYASSAGNLSSATTLTYNAAADSYTLNILQGDVQFYQTFGPGDIDAAVTDVNFTAYDKGGDALIYLNPHAPLLDLEYVTIGGWASPNASQSRDVAMGFAAGGIPTPGADMPTTGSASFAGEITGAGISKAFGIIYTMEGAIDIDADFGNGAVVSTVSYATVDILTGQIGPGYLFESNGSIASGTSLFSGPITSLDGGQLVGSLSGSFFGPAATEVGGTFKAYNANDEFVGAFIAGPAGP